MKLPKFLCLSFAASLVCANTIAWAGDVVAIMAPGSAAITKDQLANLYLGRNFDLKPLDLPEGNAIREDFYKRTTDRDAAQVKAVWSRVIFTGKGKPPQEVPDAAAVKKAVASDPKMIGYIDKTAVDATVKVVLQVD